MTPPFSRRRPVQPGTFTPDCRSDDRRPKAVAKEGEQPNPNEPRLVTKTRQTNEFRRHAATEWGISESAQHLV